MFRRKSAILLLWEMGGGGARAAAPQRYMAAGNMGEGLFTTHYFCNRGGGLAREKGGGGVEMAGSLISPTDEGAVWERGECAQILEG